MFEIVLHMKSISCPCCSLLHQCLIPLSISSNIAQRYCHCIIALRGYCKMYIFPKLLHMFRNSVQFYLALFLIILYFSAQNYNYLERNKSMSRLKSDDLLRSGQKKKKKLFECNSPLIPHLEEKNAFA